MFFLTVFDQLFSNKLDSESTYSENYTKSQCFYEYVWERSGYVMCRLHGGLKLGAQNITAANLKLRSLLSDGFRATCEPFCKDNLKDLGVLFQSQIFLLWFFVFCLHLCFIVAERQWGNLTGRKTI